MDKNSQIFDYNVNVSFTVESQPKLKRSQNKFICNECGKCFAYERIFKSHVDGAHKKPSQKMPKMAQNGQMFDSNVDASVADESKPKPKENTNFDCDKCKSVFEDKVQLKVHLKKVHLNEKPFQCGVCKRQFSSRVKLEKHVIKFHPLELQNKNLFFI